MSTPATPTMRSDFGHYDANYKNFETALYAEIRREAFGEDIGQSGWISAAEQDRTLGWLNLSAGTRLLDLACGSGGPALRIAERTGCSVVGVDVHEDAIATASSLAAQRGLADRARFQVADAGGRLPFADSQLDAITCIDSINHLPDRAAVLRECVRVLRPGGRLLFTDPITLTGPLSSEEIAIRSSIGFFLFVPPGYDQRVIEEAGLRLLVCEDVTDNMAELAQRRADARAARAEALRRIEGDEVYEKQQRFFALAARIARERRLSRFLFVAEKAG
ncbi:MAG TPA: class I SAM-dependent methyltransferase [Kofleriaceae bacterium]|nr:class I SAM-dependent methyltransferase [Kofleriaceae bacterium]